MTKAMTFDASQGFIGQCVGGKALLQAAGQILMNSDLDYRCAFQTAQVQMQMAHQLSGGQSVAEAGAAIVNQGKSGGMSMA